MADRRLPDVVASSDDPRGGARVGSRLALGRAGSAIAAAAAVHLLIAAAVVEDRHPSPSSRRVAAPAPTPSPSQSRTPEVITAEQAASRREAALETVRFAVSQACKDGTGFRYDIVESSSDVVETVFDAHDVDDVSGLMVKVTLLPGAVAYRVLQERGDCDA